MTIYLKRGRSHSEDTGNDKDIHNRVVQLLM